MAMAWMSELDVIRLPYKISRAFQRIVEAAGHLRRTCCEVFPTIKAKQCSSYLVTLYMLVLLLSRSPNRITNYILWKVIQRWNLRAFFLPLRNLPVSLLTGEIRRGFPWLLSLSLGLKRTG